MNDTHGEQGQGWIGFDLDGTLAKYDKWEGVDHIGEPIGPMVDLIKKLHADGKKVKILTARVAPRAEPETKPNPYLENHWCIENPDSMPWATKQTKWTALEFIQDWCYRWLKFVPEIVHQKDHLMLELYDDRCKQVEPNTGVIIEDRAEFYRDRCRVMTAAACVLGVELAGAIAAARRAYDAGCSSKCWHYILMMVIGATVATLSLHFAPMVFDMARGWFQ